MARSRKGFTTTLLAAVLAFIGMIFSVVFPTFSGVVEKANESAAMQQAKNALTVVIADSMGELPEGTLFFVDSDVNGAEDYAFIFEGNMLEKAYGTKAEPYLALSSHDYDVVIPDEAVVTADNGDIFLKAEYANLLVNTSSVGGENYTDDVRIVKSGDNTYKADLSSGIYLLHCSADFDPWVISYRQLPTETN